MKMELLKARIYALRQTLGVAIKSIELREGVGALLSIPGGDVIYWKKSCLRRVEVVSGR